MDKIEVSDSKTQKTEDNKQDKPDKNKSALNEVFSVVGILVLAPLIALLLTFFVFQSYVVDGPSMENTLHDQDRLIVWKASKTLSRITSQDFVPKRYSIIVFDEKISRGPQSDSSEKQLVKRVIGLPGDRIVIKNGPIMIYNQENPDGFYPDKQIAGLDALASNKGEVDYTVKPGEVYVLGDNRDNSLDSRAFGPVKSEEIIGTLAVRIYPFDKVQKF